MLKMKGHVGKTLGLENLGKFGGVSLDLLSGHEKWIDEKNKEATCGCPFFYLLILFASQWVELTSHEHPVVLPQVSHFMQVPFRTSVKLPHSEHISPS